MREGRAPLDSLGPMAGIPFAYSGSNKEITMKTLSLLALASTLSLSLAGSAFAQDATAPERGAVLAGASSTKAVVAGPIAIHAYSQYSGATLYTVKAVSGTDRDCQSADRALVTK